MSLNVGAADSHRPMTGREMKYYLAFLHTFRESVLEETAPKILLGKKERKNESKGEDTRGEWRRSKLRGKCMRVDTE